MIFVGSLIFDGCRWFSLGSHWHLGQRLTSLTIISIVIIIIIIVTIVIIAIGVSYSRRIRVGYAEWGERLVVVGWVWREW